MPMPEFESRSVGLPERPLVPPGWTPLNYQNPAETFLSAYFAATNVNAKRLAIESQMARLGLENERINKERELGEQRNQIAIMGLDQRYGTENAKLDIARMNAENKADRINDLRITGNALAQLRDAQAAKAIEETKHMAETATVKAQKEAEASRRLRLQNFQLQYGTLGGGLGLTKDAFENTNIKNPKGDEVPEEAGWYRDKNKPGQRFYRKFIEQDGQPVIDPTTKKQRYHDITVDDSTFKAGKQMYDDLYSKGATSFQLTPNDLPKPKTQSGSGAYHVGGQYGNMIYQGGDPNNPASWKSIQQQTQQ